jgi:hypothetical protein
MLGLMMVRLRLGGSTNILYTISLKIVEPEVGVLEAPEISSRGGCYCFPWNSGRCPSPASFLREVSSDTSGEQPSPSRFRNTVPFRWSGFEKAPSFQIGRDDSV